MPFCPSCRYEYVPGIKECPDCEVKLVDKLPEEKEEPQQWLDLVEVAAFQFEPEAQEAKLKLETVGIRSVISNELMSQSDIILAWADGGVKLLVERKDAKKAIEALESKD